MLDQDNTDTFRFMPFRSPAGAALFHYAKKLMEKCKACGADEGILAPLFKPDNNEVISDIEFQKFFCLLMQLQQANHSLWQTATDEFIRWASPTMHFRRTAMRDFELHDKKIQEGDKVLFWFVSGNRDDRQFEKPFEINLHRSPNRHLARVDLIAVWEFDWLEWKSGFCCRNWSSG